ncbi:TadE/TadG family type IV pilus assembly protein [Rhizobium alvei]|uniref:Pilus assembly protein n=1 Tax=Rhizobium alvei TaxID=1132659 RepID=A0ABT8YSM3_9HYPH|nr:TadE/TadG family type IV pilus assembly protein [Rhizobium alvei]MDO6966205.1 pilus assembly protein [Rhizobium alvei]
MNWRRRQSTHAFSGLIKGFRRNREGAAALEFAILAVPFLMLTFATFETFFAFAGEQVLANAVETMSRKIRTGEITFAQGKATDMTEVEFREAFCEEIAVFNMCSDSEAASPDKLHIDVRQFSSFGDMPRQIPKVSTADYADLDTTGFGFSPGGPNSINMVRAFYRWQIITDIIRPYVTTIRPEGDPLPTDYLMVSTAAIQNEEYE